MYGLTAFDNIKTIAANMPLDGEKGTYTQEMFLSEYPQFTDSDGKSLVPNIMLAMFINNANNSIFPSKWGDIWQYAAGLYVAHFSAMYLQTYAPYSNDAKQSASNAQQKGLVKSTTMGMDTIEYDNSAVTQATEKWGVWNLTSYGQQLVTMARMVGMGGTYVI